jgi:uncharacterized membrane protein
VNWQLAVALLIAAAWTWLGRAVRGPFGPFAVVTAIVLVLIAVSCEIDRAIGPRTTETVAGLARPMLRWLWCTGVWGAGGLLMIGLGRRSEPGTMRDIGWLVLIASAVTWFLAGSMWWRIELGVAPVSVGWNLPFAVGVFLSALLIAAISADGRRGLPFHAMVLAGAGLLLLLAATLEIDRAVALHAAPSGALTPNHLRLLWGTGLWAAGGFVMVFVGRRSAHRTMHDAGWFLLVASAFAWLFADTLPWRWTMGVTRVTVVLNLQFAIGALVAVLLGIALRLDGRGGASIRAAAWGLIGFIGLWLGSLEIDRALADQAMAAQAGLSVYWAIYGVMLVAVGFLTSAPAARRAGLALLCITVLKVLIFDLTNVDAMWRVVSTVGAGLLLIGTSIIYTKLSPLADDRGGDEPSGDSR